MEQARLVLADGTVFTGRAVGARGTVTGEAVFNTGMTGYQEVLTDPSYRGQIVTMTYPEIGNYGIAEEDMESGACQVSGFVMRRCCPFPSNFRSSRSLDEFLRAYGTVAIDEVDTRAITKRLREAGAVPAILSSDATLDEAELRRRAAELPSMAGQDLASRVGTAGPYVWEESSDPARFGQHVDWPAVSAHVVAIDLGIKRNILRLLVACGFRVTVVPASTTADEILALDPDGLFVSNGPGDPAPVTRTIATLRRLLDASLPTFGICLGHQLLALACGARTFKLKFGHRGANHPIKDLDTDEVEIASHNHGFAVEIDSLPDCLRMTHLNLNDGTCAGLAHRHLPMFCVQYHPEAGPGPSDPLYLFKRFSEAIAARQRAA